MNRYMGLLEPNGKATERYLQYVLAENREEARVELLKDKEDTSIHMLVLSQEGVES